MRSKVNFKGHPVHPALVHFPLAFLIGAFGFDLAGSWINNPSLWSVGAYLAPVGIIAALLAAIPGFLDYFYTVPPKSSGKRRATQHMLLNLSAVALFALAWLIRGGAAPEPSLAILLLEGAGSGALFIAGYLGGILVSRNQIGVDHRYAEAGKWQEERIQPDPKQPIVTAKSAELLVDQMKLLHIAGKRIVLARTENGYTAFEDRCTHRGGSLADGALISGVVQCPWHGSQFDVHTGAVCGGPAKQEISTYRVEQQGSDIVLYLEGGGREQRPAREKASR
ncbi:MAG TPA: DUF2231 domain-containing protein [Gemmatimonadales bacterium]|jgi:uncharacterized membrane protein/nitrite reductase/ring-hydroxylating ferredoxin subunit|nr:DUF2231 domain-containing protein [Gemmatimonadales bacterium]